MRVRKLLSEGDSDISRQVKLPATCGGPTTAREDAGKTPEACGMRVRKLLSEGDSYISRQVKLPATCGGPTTAREDAGKCDDHAAALDG